MIKNYSDFIPVFCIFYVVSSLLYECVIKNAECKNKKNFYRAFKVFLRNKTREKFTEQSKNR